MSAQRRRIGAWFVVLLAAVTALTPLTINLYLPAFPLIADELGVSHGQVQITMTATLVGVAVGQLFLGSVSDAVGRRAPLVVALGAYAVVSLVIAAAGNVALLTLLRFVQGFLGAAGMVVAMAAVRDMYEGVRVGKALSRLMLVVGVAPVIAPALGSQLLLVGSWRLLFVVLAGLAVVLLVLVLLTLPETLQPTLRRRGGTRGAARSYVSLLRDPAFVGLVAVGGLAMAGQYIYISASTFVFQEAYGLTAQQFALVFGFGAIMVTAGTQVSGALLGRVRAVRIVGGALVVAMCGAAAIAVVALTVGVGPGRLWPLLAALMPTVGAVGVLLPAVPAIALARQAHDAGSASAILGAAQFGMAAVGAPLSGVLGTSVTTMAAGMFVANALAACVLLTIARRLPGM
ncbi:multidrug effflux MFS transporter [Georgenia yuyongxinii]|uniref:Multidrug effflux MFS transporter n=1 Tax=Georgenia yuyongxinii TaxID=2589797 RepID=A0A5B8BYB3_9MICO|nr:multidrug effflux MFS transporter [Georgenia yuyongxinii]QDC23284.1 multidrug effflux MFS transporter [Georgenia yuyongxinii]